MTTNEEVFMKITNKDIYKKIVDMEQNTVKQHVEVITRLDKTNGRVKLNKWIATTALSLVLIIIGIAISSSAI